MNFAIAYWLDPVLSFNETIASEIISRNGGCEGADLDFLEPAVFFFATEATAEAMSQFNEFTSCKRFGNCFFFFFFLS